MLQTANQILNVISAGFGVEVLQGRCATESSGRFYEPAPGGDRVPFIASWPGKINPAVRSELMTHYDVYATLPWHLAEQRGQLDPS